MGHRWTRMNTDKTRNSARIRRRNLLRLRQIEHGVRWKKIKRANLEVMPNGRHYWPILGARHMMETQRIPSHDVRVFDAAIGIRPHRQTIVSFAARRIYAGRIPFRSIVGSYPELVAGECTDLLGRILRREQGLRGGSRHDFIASRIAERTLHIRIDEQPHARSVEL